MVHPRNLIFALLALVVAGCASDAIAPVVQKRVGVDQVLQSPTLVTVRRGDTLFAVAKRNGVSLRALIEENRLQPPFTIQAGRKLRLPRVTVHVVAAGDSLYSISRQYEISAASLARTNNLREPYQLEVGQKLALPAGARTSILTVEANPTAAPRRPAPRVTTTPPRNRGQFGWPVEGDILMVFGPQDGGLHNDGINIRVTRGMPILAAEDGVVAYVGNQLVSFGKLILIRHEGGWVTAYAHNDDVLVRRGQKVKRGEIVGRAGSSGSVDSPQLHFEIRKGTKAVNPLDYLGQRSASLDQGFERERSKRPAKS